MLLPYPRIAVVVRKLWFYTWLLRLRHRLCHEPSRNSTSIYVLQPSSCADQADQADLAGKAQGPTNWSERTRRSSAQKQMKVQCAGSQYSQCNQPSTWLLCAWIRGGGMLRPVDRALTYDLVAEIMKCPGSPLVCKLRIALRQPQEMCQRDSPSNKRQSIRAVHVVNT